MAGSIIGGTLKVATLVGLSAAIIFAFSAAWSRGAGDAEVPGALMAAVSPKPIPETAQTVVPGAIGRPEDCPEGWQFFDNPLLKYTICLPPGWGFHEGTTPDRITSLSPGFLRQVTAFSQEWFPHPQVTPGARIPADVAARLNTAIRIRIDLAPPGVGFDGCQPGTPRQIGGLPALYCEDAYTLSDEGIATHTPSGNAHVIRVLLPVANVPPLANENTEGYRLHLKVVSLNGLYVQQSGLIWQLIDSLRLYQ
jgi:hypothetical protein